MSTKTTFKRVALVAVAALGFGVVTSVAPGSATGAITPTAVTVGIYTQVLDSEIDDVGLLLSKAIRF